MGNNGNDVISRITEPFIPHVKQASETISAKTYQVLAKLDEISELLQPDKEHRSVIGDVVSRNPGDPVDYLFVIDGPKLGTEWEIDSIVIYDSGNLCNAAIYAGDSDNPLNTIWQSSGSTRGDVTRSASVWGNFNPIVLANDMPLFVKFSRTGADWQANEEIGYRLYVKQRVLKPRSVKQLNP